MPTNILSVMISLLLGAIPFAYWTLTPNSSTTPKLLLLAIAVIFMFIAILIDALKNSRLFLPSLSPSLPLIIFVTSISISLLANPEGRPEALATQGVIFITLTLLGLIILSLKQRNISNLLNTTLLFVGSLLSVHSLASLLFLSKSPYLPSYMQTASFTPTGSYSTTLILIIISTILALENIKKSSKQVLPFITFATGLIATIAIISLMLPGGSLAPIILPLSSSWSIALDGLKSARSLLFGIGLSNYSLLYTAVKPLSLNATSLWNTLPRTSFNEILTLLPTAGILSTASFIFIALSSLFHSRKTIWFFPVLVLTLSLLLTPSSLIIYLLIFVLYALSVNATSQPIDLKLAHKIFLMLIFSLIISGIGYITTSSFISELFIAKSQKSLSIGDGQGIYDNSLKAIKYSPLITSYHLTFADVNFRLASAISQKPELTEDDRSTISKLIQQSLDSGRTAISLRPNDSRSYLTVAKIYQNLINVASGADSFALDYYAKALSLDRANPTIRLDYASLLASLAENQTVATAASALNNRALTELQTAIQLKPDYGNAYYNLAAILEKNGDLDASIKALQETLKHLPSDSPDYARVSAELETLKTKKTPISQPPNNPTELSIPSPLPSPIPGGLLELN